MKIVIGNDHRGYKLKNKIVNYLTKKNHYVTNIGCDSQMSVDYPIYAFELCEKVTNDEADLGIIICGTGIGVSIACNKVKGIRCAKPATAKEAKLSRLHNDANVLAISADMQSYKVLDIIDAFINTNFSNEQRHQDRINLITDYESKKRSTKKTPRKTSEEESNDI